MKAINLFNNKYNTKRYHQAIGPKHLKAIPTRIYKNTWKKGKTLGYLGGQHTHLTNLSQTFMLK